jgi:5-methyltetrahydropteroyltriglutamate--homocysteine methyltransferase
MAAATEGVTFGFHLCRGNQGSREPLQHVPDDRIVVLGPVTTKTPRRETRDGLAHRIEEASVYVPLDRPALPPQCGFGTSVVGNALSGNDRRAKLRTVAETEALVRA